MTNNERSEAILLDTVEEYIHTAEPVSSQHLLKRYEYSLSSATIRNLMAKLDEAGFLYQPHISAGRIPTQKAYRFFADKVELGLREDPRKKQKTKTGVISTKFKKELQEAMRTSPDIAALMLSRQLAQLTNSMAFAGLISINHFYKEGLRYLLDEPEFLNTENVRSLLEYTDSLETHLDKLYGAIQSDIRIYVGEFEQQIMPFSLMAFTSEFPHNEKGVFGIIGPMRMHYGQNLELLNSIRELFENHD
ncbi:MAG: hypothetical protein WD712_02530 [Candidatus Spechtbacterales bacterium]